MSNPTKGKRRAPGAGRKAKPEGQKASRHIGAGVSDKEWPLVEMVTEQRGGNRSAIIRAAFGLPPAIS
jgi:hypothetical protein